MSQMREITTIHQNVNSDASATLTNGLITNGTPQAISKPNPLPTSTTKSDRNNNNVMKKSMPPPIPPKKPLKNGMAKTNTDPMLDNKAFDAISNGNHTNTNNKNSSNAISHTAVINHCHGPNALTADGNALHKLSNPSKCTDKNHGKGQCGVSNSPDNGGVVTTDCNGDHQTASDFVGIASSDNHKKLNDDIVASTMASKCSPNSGTSHHCDNNGMLQTITCFNSPFILLAYYLAAQTIKYTRCMFCYARCLNSNHFHLFNGQFYEYFYLCHWTLFAVISIFFPCHLKT